MAKRRLTAEPHVPLHQRIFETLVQEIRAGKYKPGQRFPSEAALVQQFSTSRITIGRVLSELVRRDYVHRIAGSGTFVRPRSEPGAAFGLLIPSLDRTEIFEPICRGMESSPLAGQCRLLRPPTTCTQRAGLVDLCTQFVAQGVAGVFFAPVEESLDAAAINIDIIRTLEQARVPVVLLDRDYLPYPQRSRYDLVGIDNRRAAFLATEHLIQLGARRIAFVGHALGAPTVELRLAGYREALHFHGLPEDPRCLIRPSHHDLAHCLERNRLRRPDAYLCANDHTAAAWFDVLLAAGLRVPHDARLVGIDDVESAGSLTIPLTTVHQPCRDIGHAALQVMLDRVANPGRPARDILLDCHLVVRKSCGGRLLR